MEYFLSNLFLSYAKSGSCHGYWCYMVWLNWYAKTTFYPGLVDPINQGGLGFDYYVNVSPTEMWPFLIENVPLQDWSVAEASPSIPFLIPLTSGKTAWAHCSVRIPSFLLQKNFNPWLLQCSRNSTVYVNFCELMYQSHCKLCSHTVFSGSDDRDFDKYSKHRKSIVICRKSQPGTRHLSVRLKRPQIICCVHSLYFKNLRWPSFL